MLLKEQAIMCQVQAVLQVENRAALYNFASIATAADGIVLSRGNLGLDVAPEKMALVQKSVINKCNLLGKPVIITRVVDTMATAPRPTRSAWTFVCTGPRLYVACVSFKNQCAMLTPANVLCLCHLKTEATQLPSKAVHVSQ